jgi:hypothetical protein
MRLMTKELEKRFAQVGSQENVKDPVIVAKFFDPDEEGGYSAWYATEYDPKTKMFFGYVVHFGGWIHQWEHFSLEELESYKGPLGLRIERDLYWTETKASSVIR